ncbi:MAG TPA: hypothetical protein VKV27_09490 [Solirubrobacteraceae bacterium]|nr:hypothetical protein [Solirubrobacteraceae bacterium]
MVLYSRGRIQMSTLCNEIAARARRLLGDGYGLHLVSNRDVLALLDTAPLGVPVEPLDFLASSGPADWSVADLMRIYATLNAVAFDAKGIPIPTWVMIDLGLLPSAFLIVTLPPEPAALLARSGNARTAEILTAVLQEADRLGHRGPVPVAGYCAAPTPDPAAWVGWSLCSAIPGLGTVAKGLALAAYRARTLTGVAQFSDHGLRVHRKFGRMEILRAVLDLHPVPQTLVYRTSVFDDDDRGPDGDGPSFWLRAGDLDAQRRLQARIDARQSRFFILSPGLVDDRVPILERN